MNSEPFVSFVPDVEVTVTLEDVPDLLVFMEVLIEEHLDLVLVHITHCRWRDCNHVPIFIVALRSQLVH